MNLDLSINVKGVKIYLDHKDACTFFIEPLGITVSQNPSNNKPEILFTRARFTGESNTQAKNQILDFGDLSIRFDIPTHNETTLSEIKSELKRLYSCGNIELTEILLSDINVAIALPNQNELIHLDADYSTNIIDKSITWSSKIFTFNLDRISTSLLVKLFESGLPFIDVHYVYYVNNNILEYEEQPDSIDINQTQSKKIIYSNTLTIELHEWMVKDLDLNNNEIWKNYPLLDVLNFNFPDSIYKKIVQFRAFGYSNEFQKYITSQLIFSDNQKTVQYLNFDQPVRMDYPFQYKVITVYLNGEEKESDWIMSPNWTYIDIGQF